MKPVTTLLTLSAPLALMACTEIGLPTVEANPQDQFWAALSSHCGHSYAGQLVSDDAADADMQGAQMAMHVRDCSDEQIAVPFHIKQAGEEWNRSRTWLFTRTTDGLRLKHDHRHDDGESDAVTMYGGDTNSDGTARAQDFAVDEESIALFRAEGLDASVTNVWRVEVDAADTAGGQFAYNLIRTVVDGAPEDRNFRVEFDTGQPIETPPPAWGSEPDDAPIS